MRQKCEMTEKRLKSLKARLRKKFFREHWREAIEKARQSNFCNGGGDRGWVADLDWFAKPDSVNMLMEGKFDNRQPSSHSVNGPGQTYRPGAKFGEGF